MTILGINESFVGFNSGLCQVVGNLDFGRYSVACIRVRKYRRRQRWNANLATFSGVLAQAVAKAEEDLRDSCLCGFSRVSGQLPGWRSCAGAGVALR